MSNLTNNTAELNKILAAVNALPEAGGGGINPTGTIEITENGTHDVTNYATAEVNVPSKEPVLQEGNATPTKSQQTVEPPSGVDGFSKFVVEKIPDQYIVPAGTAEIIKNGEHDVTGYAKVDVNVPDVPAVTEELNVTQNGTYEPDKGVDGFSKVTVSVPDIPAVVEDLEVTENGEYTPDAGVDGFSKVTVSVPSKEPVLQEGGATPTKSRQTVEPPSGVDGFSKFVVEKIPDQYIVPAGTAEITRNGEHDVTGYAKVDVNVPDIPAVTEELSVIKNGTWEPGAGVDGFSKVVVNVPDTPAVVRPLEVTENGTYTAPNGVDGYSPIAVNVPSENLTAEIEAQAALIEAQAGQIVELLTVLDGKAAGGGGGSGKIETCTLRIVGVESQEIPGFPTGAIRYLMYPTLDSEGNIEWVDAEIMEPTAPVEIENVVINEMLWFEGTDMTGVFNGYVSKTENAEMIVFDINTYSSYVKCTTPNAVSVIEIEPGY